jgi:cellulose synthase (UDP-forming)
MKYQIDILTKGQKTLFFILLGVWFAVNIGFIAWWIQEKHIVTMPFFILNTTVLFWTYLLPAYFFFYAARMTRPNPALKPPQGMKVAMVVTKTPAEPFALVQKTLKGMLAQKYPHDTWIADENPSEETKQWAQNQGIFISTRNGIAHYHQPTWPRRTKSKEGNLSYFYDTYGYDSYDIVVQMDADHVPQKNYLENMLRPFANPSVGYVSAPSICSCNAQNSWSARARLYAEGLLHGAQQSGHSNSFAPLCFGSHYAVRTRALKGIGGLGPELAEDHSTTLIMNANGWRGIHAVDALAIGDGPDTFADAMTQEFQWSRSLMNLFLMWMPKYIHKIPLHMKVQFLFSQLWYPLFSSIMLLGLLIPILAILTNAPIVSVSYISFMALNVINILVTLGVVFFLKRIRMLRPMNAKIISWEIIVFQIARWPWTLFGVISSLYDWVTRNEFIFKVTPKKREGYIPLPLKAVTPYILILTLYLAIGFIWNKSHNASGYYFFIITGTILYLATLGTIIFMHEYEQKK